MGVRLVVVDGPGGELHEAALRLRTGPEQARFAKLPAESFPTAFADPARTPFAVVEDHDRAERVVDAELAALLTAAGHDPARAVLLRSSVIGVDHQAAAWGGPPPAPPGPWRSRWRAGPTSSS